MDSAGKNCTVSLLRCDRMLNANVINSVNTDISMDPPSYTGVSRTTTEVKRSARLSRKRTLQDSAAVIDIVGQPGGEKIIKTLKPNKLKSETYSENNDVKKSNNRDSTMNIASGESDDGSNVPQPSPVTAITVGDKDGTCSKWLPRTYGLRSKHEERNDLVRSTKKLGRHSQKSCKGLPEPVEKSRDESESTALNDNEDDDDDDGPSKAKRKRIGNGTDEPIATSENELKVNTVCVANDPQRSSVDREIVLVANRFNVPQDTLRKIIENESVPVFREKLSDSVTLSMVTVSPIVSMTADKGTPDQGRTPNGAIEVRYKIEPNRVSVAYEKTNLKDTMDEISKTMPSWSLSIVADPPRYVLSHMSVGTYGTPIANKAVVLDRHFRASVYINQRLEYKYCKRYTTVSEIVDLIRKLDAINVRCSSL